MSENWTAISADVIAAIADIGFDVTVTRKTAQTDPWDVVVSSSALTLRVIDSKTASSRNQGSEMQQSRTILCGPGPNVPASGDRVTIRGKVCEVMAVRPVAPGGVDLFFKVDLQ